MGRIGFVFRHSKDESLSELLKACALEPFIHEGIFTHFPASDLLDSGEAFTKQQFDRFCEVVEQLEQNRYTFEIKHCSNSAAALYDPQYALDMVRIGLLLFGALPSAERASEFTPKQTMTLKTVISNVKTVKAGDSIGYGCEYIAKSDMKIATVSIGYADGFLRTSYPNGIKLTVGGKECALVGRVCMDQSMIDVTDVENVGIGDEVIVFGNGGCNSLFDFALKSGTVPHEALCLVGARVPRVYIRSNS
jgi:alanine racemase